MTTKEPLDLLGKWQLLQQAASGEIKLTRSGLLVLIRTLQHQNPGTGQCNPSIETLAHYVGLSPTSIKNGITELSDKGLLSVLRRRGCNNRYEFRPPRPFASQLQSKPASKTKQPGLSEPGAQSCYEKKKKKKEKEERRQRRTKDVHPSKGGLVGPCKDKGPISSNSKRQSLENAVYSELRKWDLPVELPLQIDQDQLEAEMERYLAAEVTFLEARNTIVTACVELMSSRHGRADLSFKPCHRKWS